QGQSLQKGDDRERRRLGIHLGPELSRVDPTLDDRRQQVVELAKVAPQIVTDSALPGGHRVELKGDRPHPRDALHLQRGGLDEVEQLGSHRSGRGPQGTHVLQGVTKEKTKDGKDNRVLALVIEIERALAQPRLGRDVVHPRLVETQAGEDRGGRVEDLALSRLGYIFSRHWSPPPTVYRSRRADRAMPPCLAARPSVDGTPGLGPAWTATNFARP